MDVRSNAAPVIIKRKKIIAGGGHHGGAWKVAYADFVTAMMAFFLLMWLLNATTEQQRKGIADYFSPTLPVNRISGGGDGAFGGDSVFSEETLAQNGIGATSTYTSDSRQARGDLGLSTDKSEAQQRAVEDAAYARVADMLTASGGESLVSDDILQHIRTRVTDEGLVIELFDVGESVLFTERAQSTHLLEDLAALIARVSQLVENDMAIEAYLSARPVTLIDNPVWDVSSARSNRMRMLLEEDGIAPARVKRVTGHADRSPAVEDPMAPRNNRLEVILLRSD
jgi:chemotaxis protein MotB